MSTINTIFYLKKKYKVLTRQTIESSAKYKMKYINGSWVITLKDDENIGVIALFESEKNKDEITSFWVTSSGSWDIVKELCLDYNLAFLYEDYCDELHYMTEEELNSFDWVKLAVKSLNGIGLKFDTDIEKVIEE